jgi:hypothetical protein
MNTTNDVIRKLEFLIKNHQNEVAVSYYKWIIKAILLEKEYNQICELSGKRIRNTLCVNLFYYWVLF